MLSKDISKIRGYEDLKGYEITENGDVYSYWKIRTNSKGMFTEFSVQSESKRKLKPLLDSKGYQYVDLKSAVRRRCPKIHRLVALAFIPNPENKPQVNHIDGSKINNNVSNLEWVTNEENRTHAITNKLKDEISYGVAQYDMDDNLIAVFPTAKKALESLGIESNTGGNIGRVIKGKRKSAYGYKWRQI